MRLLSGVTTTALAPGAKLKLRFTRGANTIPSSTLWIGNVRPTRRARPTSLAPAPDLATSSRPQDLSSIWCGRGSHLPSISPDQVELEKDELVDEIQRLRRPSRLNLCAGKNSSWFEMALPCLKTAPHRPATGSQGPGRSYPPRSAA